jgi:hypothetical protein
MELKHGVSAHAGTGALAQAGELLLEAVVERVEVVIRDLAPPAPHDAA